MGNSPKKRKKGLVTPMAGVVNARVVNVVHSLKMTWILKLSRISWLSVKDFVTDIDL